MAASGAWAGPWLDFPVGACVPEEAVAFAGAAFGIPFGAAFGGAFGGVCGALWSCDELAGVDCCGAWSLVFGLAGGALGIAVLSASAGMLAWEAG